MSNFQFILPDFPKLGALAQKAEQFALTSPVESCFNSRAALEVGVNWMYRNDAGLRWPYQPTLANLMYDSLFRDLFETEGGLYAQLHIIRKKGNEAVHQQSVKRKEAVHLLHCLHQFAAYLIRTYGEQIPHIDNFNDQLLPTGDELKKTRKELEALRAKLVQQEADHLAQQKDLAEKEERNELLRLNNEKLKQQVKAQRQERAYAPPPVQMPSPPSEAYTREMYIDTALKEAGWTNLRDGYELEYELQGMPKSTNPSGRGYADYVLWADNGLPLAVIEAKRTTTDARTGRHQAKLYAYALEQKFGQRPLIYYTNGFDFYLWDDLFAPARKVAGFMSKDQLELAIKRRKTRTDLRSYSAKLEITGRPYQTEAIQRVAETYCTAKEGQLKQYQRKALLIMATGSGKTRTAVSIVDMLMGCNWAKRVLFLADRNALVTQAKNSFNDHLPQLSAIDLTKEKENDTTRLVFSTYPTMMGQIDKALKGEGRFYGVGHFDLIIIDEAHRSVYQKYRAIFEYFDAFLLGLTATPKKHMDHNTYSLFDIEDDNPTFAYELNEAVNDQYLVPPRGISVPLKFMREGIKYADLSPREKAEYEEKFGDPTHEEADAGIPKSELYKWLFNTNTVDKVLNHLMTSGIKVDGGDKLGKTIIFAKNHKHALYIKERFDKNFPEHAGVFCEVIDNQVSKAEDLIDSFKLDKEEKLPQIAISVDMMDTGVDAPRVVNLVFFKPVRSVVKYRQMIGRGTRLRPDLFGSGKHKEHFLVFDYCENFEFFDDNPEGIVGSGMLPITQQIFLLRLELARALRMSMMEEERVFGEALIDLLQKQVAELDQERFQVRAHLEWVEKYKYREHWDELGPLKQQEITEHIVPLVIPEEGDHVTARKFDVLMLNYQLACLGGKVTSKYVSRITAVSTVLKRKQTIPAVVAAMPMLEKVTTYGFLEQAGVVDLEEVRNTLRDLMRFLEAQQQQDVETHFQDYLDQDRISEVNLLKDVTSLIPYRRRVERYLEEHSHHLVIHKIKNNQPITDAELKQLEDIFFNADEVGTQEEFEQEEGEKPLTLFIRQIIGLEREALQGAFAQFINDNSLNAGQIKFVDLLISYLSKNGVIDKKVLFESPFRDLNDNGPFGLFDDAQVTKIISILDRINGNADMG